MKTTSGCFTLVAAVLLSCAAAIVPARAQIIGLDFSGAGTPVPSTTLAGFDAQTYWNNLSTNSGSLAAGTITDSTNAFVSGLSATWGSNGSDGNYNFGGYSFTGPNATGNTDLYSSTLFAYGPGASSGYQVDVTLTGIPYASYTVYAYFEGGNGIVNLNGTPNGSTFTGGTTLTFSSSSVGDFVAADPSGDPADYGVFTGQTASSLTLYDQQGSGGGLVGIQIVNTAAAAPEPSTYALLGLGATGLFLVRRRQLQA